jgi:hypothetical protein
MTPLSALTSFFEVFAALFTFIVGYLLCLVVLVLILVAAQFIFGGTRRVRQHVHRTN